MSNLPSEDRIRVTRTLVYEGRRSWIEQTLSRSFIGSEPFVVADGSIVESARTEEIVSPVEVTMNMPTSPEIANAPWTDEQVANLNRWQQAGYVHEWTCPNDHPGSRTLVADNDGWWCVGCGYTQNWAHPNMLQGPPPSPFCSGR
jgi:hypothetical protein